jgi:molecular chaperone GrpE
MNSEPVAEAAETPASGEGAVSARLDAIDGRLTELAELFRARIEEDAVKGELFAQLHRDLARYRDDFIFTSITRRLFSDLLRLFDRIEATLEKGALATLSQEDLVAHLQSFRNETVECLRRQEVNMIETPVGIFDETWQEAVEARPVEKVEDDQRVLGVVRHGFTYRDRVLRPTGVIVGQYQKPKET